MVIDQQAAVLPEDGSMGGVLQRIIGDKPLALWNNAICQIEAEIMSLKILQKSRFCI